LIQLNFKYIPEMPEPGRYAWMRMQLILQIPGYNTCIKEKGLSQLTYQTYEDLRAYALENKIGASIEFERAWYASLDLNPELATRFGEALNLDWQNPNKMLYVKMLRFITSNRKINAIKTMRQIWNIGLKDSKYFCDDLMDLPEANEEVKRELELLAETNPEYVI